MTARAMRHWQKVVMWLIGAFCVVSQAQSEPSAGKSDFIQVTPFPSGGEFHLQNRAGTLHSQNLRGKVVVLFFGYTQCPDVCPLSMHTFSQAYALLAPRQRKRVQAVFVSVDPERDTPDVLAGYTGLFKAPIVAATASPEALAELADRYGAQYRRVELPGSAMGYAIDHSAALYVIDPRGQLKTLLRHDARPAVLAKEIQAALRS